MWVRGLIISNCITAALFPAQGLTQLCCTPPHRCVMKKGHQTHQYPQHKSWDAGLHSSEHG